MSKGAVLRELGSKATGLTQKEAEERLHQYGPNQLTEKKKASALKVFLSQFKSFIVYILIAAFFVSLFIGEFIDAGVIAGIIILNAVLGFFQEFKAEKSIEALKKLTAPNTVVIRDGKVREESSLHVVAGDILELEEGAKIPADCYIIESHNLKVDESALTGESVPGSKKEDVTDKEVGVSDRTNMLFSGTIIVGGRAKAVVTATAMKTEIGKIADLVQSAEQKITPLQKKLQKFGIKLGIAVIVICVVILIMGLLRGQEFFHMLMISISLAVAAVPEGLPAVVTICLALGVQRMIKKNVLMRRLSSVETLGSTNVICSDKTGTLTCNEMTVRLIYANGKLIQVTGAGYSSEGSFLFNHKKFDTKELRKLFETGVLCNNAQVEGERVIGDPTEAALLVTAKKAGVKSNYKRLDEIPFSSDKKYMTTINEIKGKRVMHVKGAPEIIMKRCVFIDKGGRPSHLSKQERKKILDINEAMAKKALRVLAFAYTTKAKPEELVFLGLMAMIDPPRDEVREALLRCENAGIRVVMITGDHALTAKAIGSQLGFGQNAVTGAELDKMSDKELIKQCKKIDIYARVNPEHKMRIVEALKKRGNVVAMTGDGVNDAPALKRSDIGIAVSDSTDVAKEAADMLLTDKHFKHIVNAVEEGRGIYDNIKKFINYMLSSNMGEVLVLFVAIMIGFRDSLGKIAIPLLAVQILWINLVTDGLPALALGVDPSSPNIMKQRPRKKKDGIITKNMGLNIIVIGALMCVAVLALFAKYLPDVAKAQTVAFTTIVVLEIVRVQMIRSQYKISFFSNKWLIGAIVVSLLLQLAVIYLPIGNKLFKTVPLGLEWLWIIGVTVVVFLVGRYASQWIRTYTHELD